MTVASVPTIYFPRKPGDQGPPEPVPYVLSDEDLIRLLQLGNGDPKQTLARYRSKGLLRAFQAGQFNRYDIHEVLEFIERLKTLANPAQIGLNSPKVR